MTGETLPTGVRLGLDWGGARIGVAACDASGMLAYPVETVSAASDPYPRLLQLVEDYRPVAIVMGLPLTLAGVPGIAAQAIGAQATALARLVAPVGVYLIDERLTTAAATKRLRAAGRDSRRQRGVVDQVAAMAILEQVLDAERAGRRVQARRVDPEEDA